jgi:hypothetical protein
MFLASRGSPLRLNEQFNRAVTHGDQLTINDVGPWALQARTKGTESLDTVAGPSRGYFRFDTPDEFSSSSAWPSNANDSNPGVLNNPSLHAGTVTGSPLTIDGYTIAVGTRIVQFRELPDTYEFYAQGTSLKILYRGCRFRSEFGYSGIGIFNDASSTSSQQIMLHYCDIGLTSKDPPNGTEGLMHIKFLAGQNHRLLRNYHTISATYIQPNAQGCEITENYIDDYLYPYGDGGTEGVLPNPNAGHLNGLSTEGGLTSIKILRNRILAPSPDGATGSTGTALGQVGYGTQPGQSGYGAGTAPGRIVPATDCIAIFTNGGDNIGDGVTGLQIKDNYVGGTGWCIYAPGVNSQNVTLTGNKITTRWWTNGGQSGAITAQPTWGSNGNTQSNNTWADDFGTGGNGTTAVANRQYPLGNGPRAGTSVI